MFLPSKRRSGKRRILLLAIAASCLAFLSCTGLRVPSTPPTFDRDDLFRISTVEISLEARPIEKLETYWKMFEEDLPSAGIGAIWVRIRNAGQVELELENLRWKYTTGTHKLRSLNPEQVLKQYYKGRKIRIYSVHSHEKALEALNHLTIDTSVLPPGEVREGIVFIKIPSALARHWSRDGMLAADGLRGPGRKKIRIELSFTHANS